MNQQAIASLLVVVAAACMAVLCGPRTSAQALKQDEATGLDNRSSGGIDVWTRDALYSGSWLADPSGGAYGYPWRYYDDTYFPTGRDSLKNYSRWPADLFATMGKRQEQRRDKARYFRDAWRRNRDSRGEDIRQRLHDVFSRKEAPVFFDRRQFYGQGRRAERQGRSFGAGRRGGR